MRLGAAGWALLWTEDTQYRTRHETTWTLHHPTCVHRPLAVQAVAAALVRLPSQSDSDLLLRQTTCADRPAPGAQTREDVPQGAPSQLRW